MAMRNLSARRFLSKSFSDPKAKAENGIFMIFLTGFQADPETFHDKKKTFTKN